MEGEGSDVAPSMLDRLAIVDEGDDRFTSREPTDTFHVFGGLLVAQALRAAAMSVSSGQHAHSLHASFVAAGSPGERVRYEVERTRDGSSFGTRRVVARQDKGVVLVLTAAFHAEENGVEYALPPVAGVPGPDGLPAGRYNTPHFESRDVPPGVPPEPPHARRAWFRALAPLPNDTDLHVQAIAYVSDHGPTRAAREPHAHLDDDARRQSVSLDHSVWFHRSARADEWLLSEVMPVATGRGRGLATGTIRTADGALVATLAQEVLLRER
jgi:acyl-CoA thioesterase II